MNVEEQLRDDLHAAPIPTALVPPVDLADTVLQKERRHRRTRTTLTGVAAAVALAAVGVPLTLSPGGGAGAGLDPGAIVGQAKPSPTAEPATPGEPRFVTPGGGPQAIHVYAVDETSYLLNPATGRYHKLPYRVSLSPDLREVAVEDANGRPGVAVRDALLREGESAIRWIDVPAGNGLQWSPDGKALLFTSINKDGKVSFTAHRYDLATAKTTDTRINVEILGSSVGWAVDSKNYVALLRGKGTNDTVEPGVLQYLKPDGTLGQRLPIEGGFVGGAQAYSQSRRYMLADASEIMSARPVASKVLEAETGRILLALPDGAKPVGWYDEKTVVLLSAGPADDSVLELLDVTTGAVTKRIEMPGVPQLRTIQIASSAGLTGSAAKFGF